MAKPEWAIDRDWAESIFDELVGDDWHDDTVYIGNAAQLKLLNHIDKKYRCGVKEDMACGYIMIPPEDFQQMKSQLEKER